jgi:CTP synthase
VEIVEIEGHPYFLGCQFHPEFKSKPLEPHPLFVSFLKAAHQHKRQKMDTRHTVEVERFLRPERVVRS